MFFYKKITTGQRIVYAWSLFNIHHATGRNVALDPGTDLRLTEMILTFY